MADKTVLVLHGWGGNKPEHWQEHLVRNPPSGVEIVAPKFPDPTCPNPNQWIPLLEEVHSDLIGKAESLTVVAHSLGAITWLHVAARATRRIADRVLLVAPPYVLPGVPPWSAPQGVDCFFPPPLNPEAVACAARQVHLVGGNDDDYATWEQMETYAKRLGIGATCLNGAGHISPYWGYGRWEWVEQWCAGAVELPPLPRA